MTPDWTLAVHHDGSPVYVSAPEQRVGGRATIRLRVGADAPVRGVWLRSCPDGEQAVAPMAPAGADAVCRWWSVDLPIGMLRTGYRWKGRVLRAAMVKVRG